MVATFRSLFNRETYMSLQQHGSQIKPIDVISSPKGRMHRILLENGRSLPCPSLDVLAAASARVFLANGGKLAETTEHRFKKILRRA